MALPHASSAPRRARPSSPFSPPSPSRSPTSSRRASAAALAAAAAVASAALLLASTAAAGRAGWRAVLAGGGGGALWEGPSGGWADAVPPATFGSGDGSAPLRVFQVHPSALLGGAEDGDEGGSSSRRGRRTAAELRRMRASVLADDAPTPGWRTWGGIALEHVVAELGDMRSFLEREGDGCLPGGGGSGGGGGNAVLRRFDELSAAGHAHLAAELWKHCSLYLSGGAYVDGGSPLLSTFRDGVLSPAGAEERGGLSNLAVLGDPSLPYARSTIHGSVLLLPRPGSAVARGVVRLLATEDVGTLAGDPLVIPRALYALVAEECGVSPHDADRADAAAAEGSETGTGALRPGRNGPDGEWTLLSMRCRGSVSEGGAVATVDSSSSSSTQLAGRGEEEIGRADEYRIAHQCPKRSGYCCEVLDPSPDGGVVLMTRHPLLPFQALPPARELPKPYRADKSGEEAWEGATSSAADAPFISTLREDVAPRPKAKTKETAPNFFDVLLANDCLPSDKFCSQCLRTKKGATCKSCKDVCPCYCNALCKTEVEKKFVSKTVTVRTPVYRRDPSRLVPKIVHQTWFEDVTKEKYPNMSRLIESWKRSGWEYRFYSDATAQEYLSTHFPPEVREAYDAIKPGAFKADLFRYCVLLVDGGVYADMDVLLEANLDAAVPGDVGFMTPLDEPGKSVGHRMCLWNGLIASAPGHPFLAKTIETVVNNIRNRFTSVDVDNMLCPNPELSVSHSFDILFTAGPCMLGMSINNLLGRHPQTSFEAGDVDPFAEERKEAASAAGGEGREIDVTAEGKGEVGSLLSIPRDDPRLRIPGRTVILSQNKWDMGAHRFTWEERNLVVAATDMPDYDDRDKLEGNVHYSDTHVKFGIYGLEKLYVDREVANEDIHIVVKDAVPGVGGGDDGRGRRKAS